VLVAALLASFAAWLGAVGIDWIWELTAVALVGVLLLGLLTGPATAQDGPKSAAQRPRGRRFAIGVAAVLVVWTLIIAQAIPLLSRVKISESQNAVRAGDAGRALGNAEDARRLQPWAASPYLQLALVREATDDLPGAQAAIENAIERDPLDWRLWLVRARIETNSGEIAAARESLSRAKALNPRSPLFANVP
jgi:tetratricopeptide (TPR) repeat protein